MIIVSLNDEENHLTDVENEVGMQVCRLNTGISVYWRHDWAFCRGRDIRASETTVSQECE